MAKKKKKLRKRINPEKSNKMIYAVAAGLVVVFGIFVIILTSGGAPPENKKEYILDLLDYVKKTSGVIDLKVFPEKNKVIIVHTESEKTDFPRVAHFAGIRVSNKLDNETIEVVLAKESEENVESTLYFRDGEALDR